MSFEPPAGILDIGNATLRVGKLEVAETSGLNQGLQNIIKNDLLITENTTYAVNHKWGLKLPTTWVGEFEVKGHSGKYIDFNFYNENSASNAQGYNLTFMDTTMTLRYDGGSTALATATIPTIVGAFRKVNIFFERGVISVSIDGTRYLYFKESDTYNANHGHSGVASRVVSTTGSAFVNLFIEQNAGDSAFKNLRIVNGRFISDKTSNIAFMGGNLGVGVNSPKEALDIRGNMHFNRVSNVSSVSVDSNVVTEYTGPHDRPLRKYPEVAMTANDNLSTSGYKASVSSLLTGNNAFNVFDATGATTYWHSQYPYYTHVTGTYNPGQSSSGTGTPSGTLPTTQLIPTSRGGDSHQGEWIKLQMPTRIKLEEVRVYASNRASTNIYQMPKDIAIAGSNDGTNWYLVDSGTLRTGIRESYGMASLPVTTSSYYSYLALIVKTIDNQGANYSAIEIANIEYYGHEEGDSSLDTTLKTVYNVPATTGTQLEVYYDAKDLDNGNAPTNPVDLSPNTNNATLGGDPQVSNGAFVFDGTGDYITGTHGLSVPGQPVHSQCVWFKITGDTSDYQYISIIGTTNSTNQAGLVLLNDGTTLLGNYYGGDRVITTITQNVWYHAVLVYTGTTTEAAKYYINGVEVITTGLSGAAPITPTITGTTLRLGANTAGGQELNGSIANFRLYSKVLNADQVKELYDYQKDYFLGSKSQVTLYKGHLGVGVTEPSGQLELAGDERIQEYPPRGMTNPSTYIEGHGVFKAYGFQPHSSYPAWQAFDHTGNLTSVWYSDSLSEYSGTGDYSGSTQLAPETVKGAYIVLEMPYEIVLKQIKFWQQFNGSHVWDRGVYYAKCNPSDEWTAIHNVTDRPANDDTPYVAYITDSRPYKYFAIVITRRYTADATQGVSIRDLQFFGTPGPTTLDKGSLSLTRSLDVPRVSRYDVDTETPRPEKLVLDYDTTVNSSLTDISGNGNHGVFNGGAKYSAADKAFTGATPSSGFNGNTNYISGNLSGVSGAYAHTQSYWVNGADTTPRSPFTVGKDVSTTREFLNMWFTTSKWVMNIDGFGFQFAETIYDNQWYHLAVTYDGGSVQGSYKFYVNGEYKIPTSVDNASSFNSLNLPSNPEVRIGRNNGSQWYNGMVSNPKIYSVALEASEVKKLYNLGRTGRSMVISDTAVGIGKAPEAQLDVRGNISCNGVFKMNAPIAFFAYSTNNAAGSAGTVFTGFNATKFNYGNNFNTSTGIFTVPISGVYTLSATMRVTAINQSVSYYDLEHVNSAGTSYAIARAETKSGAGTDHMNVTAIYYANSGDKFRILVKANMQADAAGYSNFCGSLLWAC